MPLHVYRKGPLTYIDLNELKQGSQIATRTDLVSSKSAARWVHLFPAVMVTLGSMLIANVTWPILQYQLFIAPQQQEVLLSPLPIEQDPFLLSGVAPVQAEEDPEPIIITSGLDYTNLSQWFNDIEVPLVSAQGETLEYTISIPSLNIEDALVRVGGMNLDQSLIQYPGTANPGELGSPILFGHSVSPMFYNPAISNPKRYISIFTKIMQLKKDDEIIVKYDGITYVYRVTNKTEVKPDDTYILEQRYDQRELKLVTCTPPGTYLRRGIVFAQLEEIQ